MVTKEHDPADGSSVGVGRPRRTRPEDFAGEPSLKRTCGKAPGCAARSAEPAPAHSAPRQWLGSDDADNARQSDAASISPSDSHENQNTNTLRDAVVSTASGPGTEAPELAHAPALVGESQAPQAGSASSVSTPHPKSIDTLMGGEPLTETDDRGNIRFYPVLVQSDGTQVPVSAEYLRAMGLDWPPQVRDLMQGQQRMEAIASELFQRSFEAVAQSFSHLPAVHSDRSRSLTSSSGCPQLITGAQSRPDEREVSPPVSPTGAPSPSAVATEGDR